MILSGGTPTGMRLVNSTLWPVHSQHEGLPRPSVEPFPTKEPVTFDIHIRPLYRSHRAGGVLIGEMRIIVQRLLSPAVSAATEPIGIGLASLLTPRLSLSLRGLDGGNGEASLTRGTKIRGG